MRTSTMVWVIIIVLLVLGLGWYFWSSNVGNMPITATGNLPAPTPSANTDQASSTQNGMSGMPMNVTVTYNGSSFSSSTITVMKGATVTWTDTAGKMWLASDPHPVHTGYDGTDRATHCAAGYTGAAPFDECSQGTSFSFTFNKTGTFGYHDHLNHDAKGTVVVQ
jgi:plastocyanin